jgi:hypothetical protein
MTAAPNADNDRAYGQDIPSASQVGAKKKSVPEADANQCESRPTHSEDPGIFEIWPHKSQYDQRQCGQEQQEDG